MAIDVVTAMADSDDVTVPGDDDIGAQMTFDPPIVLIAEGLAELRA